MEAADSTLRAGYRLDRYELICPIASGGMASVWLARLRGKRGFEKLFAVKTIRTELGSDARFQEMFLDEARIASGIQHPNVAQILDLGEQQEILYIVMEWVDGDSLAKVRKLAAKVGLTLPTGVALRLLADAAGGLHSAHELRDDAGEPLGIVHRDVSPQNILVSTAGVAKVIDFGIAKAKRRQQGETRTGIVKGKIHYLAPEQVQKGATVDRRVDVWALGMCLHEIVAGKLPWDDADDIEVIRALAARELPPLASGLPDPVLRILEKAIAIDPDARFPTAAGMQKALEGAMKQLGLSSTADDVAEFLRTELPELAEKRKEVVSKAIDDSKSRIVAVEQPTPSGEANLALMSRKGARADDDVAFAPTVISGEPEPIAPLTKRKQPGDPVSARRIRTDAEGQPPTRREGRLEPAAIAGVDDDEPFRIPKKSRAWLWVVLLLVAGGGVGVWRYPVESRALLGRVWPGLAPQGAAQPGGEPTSTTGTASGPVIPPPPSGAAATSAQSAQEAASAAAHGAAPFTFSGAPGAPHGVQLTFPSSSAAASAAPSASAAPTAPTAKPPASITYVQLPPPDTTASVAPPPASVTPPAASTTTAPEDPGNPYNN
jgi:serine/threonine protein kinase